MPLDKVEIARRRMVREIREKIRAGRIAIIDIPDGQPAFAYTVGRTQRGLPELLLVGSFNPVTINGLLNMLDREMPAPLPTGSFVDLGGTYPVLLIDATDPAVPEEYTCFCGLFYEEYRVQQLLMCDAKGNFQGHPDCDPRFRDLPILGEINWPSTMPLSS